MEKIAELEALLFYYGEPISIKRIAALLDISEKESSDLVQDLAKNLEESTLRGICLVDKDGMIQLLTKPEGSKIIQKIMKEEFREELSPASLETLSLIAYLGPVTRPTVDFIRGVNSSFTVRNLLLRGLIERETGKGNAYEYKPSIDFLSHLGIKKTTDLPEYDAYRDIFINFEESQKEQEIKSEEIKKEAEKLL